MARVKPRNRRVKRPSSPLRKLLKKRPKRNTNAFGIYLREFWSAVGNDPANRNRNVLKNAAAQWKLMSDRNRSHYQIASEIGKRRYTEQMNAWKAERRFLTRPAGVYALFVKDTWHNICLQTQRNESSLRCISCMGKYCSKQWKKLPLKGKQHYQERFERSKRRYTTSLQDYKAKRLRANDFERILDSPEEYESVQLSEEKNSDEINDEDDYQEVNHNSEEEDFEDYDDEYSENYENSEQLNDKSEEETDEDSESDFEEGEDEYADYRQYI